MLVKVLESLFVKWKGKKEQMIENIMIDIMNYEKGVDSKTCYDDIDFLLRKAFFA